jgi:Anti-sigma factor NepR
MSYRDEDILAYIDGEMSATDRAAFETALAENADLAARTEQHRRLGTSIKTHYAPIANEPVPDRFADLLVTGDAASSGDTLLDQIKAWFSHPLAMPGASAMASLAIGILVGAQFIPLQTGISGDTTIASAQLAAALNAADGSDAWQIPVTFRDETGRYCRAFRGTGTGTSGLACRDAQSWEVQVLVTGDGAASGGYQLASSPLPAMILESVDGLIDGDPLDADAIEMAARADWME